MKVILKMGIFLFFNLYFWDIGKQRRPRSGSSLFVNRNIYSEKSKTEKVDIPKTGNGLVQLIRMGGSTRQMWVKGVTSSAKMIDPIILHHFRATNPSILKFLEQNAGISSLEARNPRGYVDKAVGYYFKRWWFVFILLYFIVYGFPLNPIIGFIWCVKRFSVAARVQC